MPLKQATSLALILIIASLVLDIIRWVIITFNLFTFEGMEWFYRSWIVDSILLCGGLILFLVTLNKKQKGESNVR